MLLNVANVKLPIKHDHDDLVRAVARSLRIPVESITSLTVNRRSIDARDKTNVRYAYGVTCDVRHGERLLQKKYPAGVTEAHPIEYRIPEVSSDERPVIVGFGPAGIFCAYLCVEAGLRPIIIERGSAVEERRARVDAFWEKGLLDPDVNVQFGEGGAGAFSDGKLNTLIKDRTGRCRFVLETLVKFGAPAEILHDARPHVGTDLLGSVIRDIREYVCERGAEVMFDMRMTELAAEDGRITGVRCACTGPGRAEPVERFIECSQVILAIGHSARDTFEMLHSSGIQMESKAFAVGLRIEHARSYIDQMQYGKMAQMLPAAPYKVTARSSSGRGVYSFCMCPGGYVVNASSEPGMLAINGMSYSGRNGDNSNAAIIVTVTPEDYPGRDVLSGVEFQRDLERRAHALGGGCIPVQRLGDYAAGFGETLTMPECGHFEADFGPQTKGDYAWADLCGLLPGTLGRDLLEGLTSINGHMPGFAHPDACLSGVESRTSSPVRITRNESGQSESIRGLYPCGEGAGYAGGITSAAMDGLYVGEMILKELLS